MFSWRRFPNHYCGVCWPILTSSFNQPVSLLYRLYVSKLSVQVEVVLKFETKIFLYKGLCYSLIYLDSDNIATYLFLFSALCKISNQTIFRLLTSLSTLTSENQPQTGITALATNSQHPSSHTTSTNQLTRFAGEMVICGIILMQSTVWRYHEQSCLYYKGKRDDLVAPPARVLTALIDWLIYQAQHEPPLTLLCPGCWVQRRRSG